MAPPKFTEIEDEQLITEVRSYPCLYDQRDKDFRNTVVKACSWKNISEVVGRDVENCKRRWKDMRDNYFKIKRHNKKRPKWLLFPVLSFLEDVHYRERRPHNTDTIDETSLDDYPPNSVECSIEESPSSWSLDDCDDDHDEMAVSRMREKSRISLHPRHRNGRKELVKIDTTTWNGSDNPCVHESDTQPYEQDLLEPPEMDVVLGRRPHILLPRGHDSKQHQLPETRTTTSGKRVGEVEIDGFARSLAKIMRTVPPNLTASVQLSSARRRDEEDDDDVDSFMRSIAKTLKTMSPRKIARAKMSILSTVTELQFAASPDRKTEEETEHGSWHNESNADRSC